MKTREIVELSEAIAARAKKTELSAGATVIEDRGLEQTLKPSDARYEDVDVELDPEDASGERVKGVRIRLAQPEAAPWGELEERFGPFHDEAALMDAPEVPPQRVGAAKPEGALPQTIRIAINADGDVTSFVVREHYE